MNSHKRIFESLLMLAILLGLFVLPATGYAQTDYGWSDPVNLSLSGSATNPILVVDLTGTIHSIWTDHLDKGYKYSQSSDGKTWTPPRTVAFPFNAKDTPPVFLIDPSGIIHIFWISSPNGLFYAQANPSDLGNPGNWRTSTNLARDVLSFDVTLDSRNILNIAYIKKASVSNVGDSAGVYYRQAVLGGGTWSAVINLYTSEYFRADTENTTYVRISTSSFQSNERIYVTWDNRSQKRIFMAASGDAGLTWGTAQEMKGPENTGGVYSPFNLTVGASGNNVLLIWQVGNPGTSACTVYSQWSADGGKTWGDTVAVLGGRSECPVNTKIVDQNEAYITVMLVGQVNPIVLAWNGKTWSDSSVQTQLPPISNPQTFDSVLLGCRFDLFYKQRLYVTGCDEGKGGDVWFLSRTMEPVESWFSASSFWVEANIPSVKSEQPTRFSNFSSAADKSGNVHVLWTSSLLDANGVASNSIQYARWDGKQWSSPVSIFGPLKSIPVQLAPVIDSLGRFHTTWIDSNSGDVVYSWANVEKAGLRSEWADIAGVSSPSHLISSPDSIVDGSGRIVTAYAVPLNEGRGIYVVQSTDNGSSWSTPIQIFDAASAGWERIDHPKLSLNSDGTLHLIFIRQTIRAGQATGLYYSQSVDGGVTWSTPQALSQADVQWADIASYRDKTVHVVWQEYDGLVFANLSEVSQDGGKTWDKQKTITGVNAEATVVALASDGHGLLHFIQLVKKAGLLTLNQENLILQDWKWDGNVWSSDGSNDVTIQGAGVNYSLSANITSSGSLDVFIPVEYSGPVDGVRDSVLFFYRNLGGANGDQASPAVLIPTLLPEENQNNVTVSQSTPTPVPDLPTLHEKTNSLSSSQKTVVGLILIGVVVITSIILFNGRSLSNRKK